MTAPDRRRRPGAAVGALVTLLVLVGLLTLGGRSGGDPAGRPEALDRRAVHPTAPVLERRVEGATGQPTRAAWPDVPTLPVGPVVSVVLLALGVVALVGSGIGPSRPVPVRVGRGPPRRAR